MNTRKPTKREAEQAQDGMVWHGFCSPGNGFRWTKRDVNDCRVVWMPGDFWLPYDAIPDPTQRPPAGEGEEA